MISALVILLAADGTPITGSETPITSETVARYAPDPGAANAAMAEFERLGFTVGPLVGNSFSIEADQSRFEQVFGGRVEASDDGLRFVAAGARGHDEVQASRDLPLDALPEPVRKTVECIVFPEPPDFGPTNF